MLRSLVHKASRLLNEFNRSLWRNGLPHLETETTVVSPPKIHYYERLERILLTDEVNRTILEEFSAHRRGERGEEETGWVLLGIRDLREATVLATLPAGAGRDAGVAHVQFNSTGQALASRIVRQWDKRLTILGVLHTHPGSLRHPSDGDYRGDIQWVGRLRGKEGVFGIGTADVRPQNGKTHSLVAYQPQKHMQIMGELCLSWYSLREGDRGYRPLPIELTIGPDLAAPLRPVWSTIETHAEQLERLCLQQAGVQFEMITEKEEAALAIQLKLARRGEFLRVLLNEGGARYYWLRDDDLIEVDPKEPKVDRGVYLILAELAG